jgi:hypothetical protein
MYYIREAKNELLFTGLCKRSAVEVLKKKKKEIADSFKKGLETLHNQL